MGPALNHEQEEFLQAIREDPENDQLRLIYADWLEEHGNSHGELIRLQFKLAGLSSTHRETALESRAGELIRQFQALQLGCLPSDEEPGFSRGFVERLTLRVNDVHGWQSVPIQLPDGWSTLAPMTCLRSLVVRPRNYCGFGSSKDMTWLEELMQSPALIALNSLDLSHNLLGPAGVAIIASSPYLSHLTCLRLAGWDCTTKDTDPDCHPTAESEGIIVLAQSPFAARLTDLDISLNELNETAVRALVGSPYLVNLRRLCIRPDGPWPTYERESELLPNRHRALLVSRFGDVFDG